MTIQQQKDVAEIVFKKLRLIDRHCLLAGGAPRDWFMGSECRDLDFYFHLGDMPARQGMERVKWLIECILSVEISQMGDGREHAEMYASMPGLHCVWEATFEGMPLNLMLMKQPTFSHCVEDFGEDICKFYTTNTQWPILYEMSAAISIVSKIVLYNENYTTRERQLNKMKERFPQFEFLPRTGENIAYQTSKLVGMTRAEVIKKAERYAFTPRRNA